MSEAKLVGPETDGRQTEEGRSDWIHRIWPELPTTKEARRETAVSLAIRTFRASAVTTIAYVLTLWLIPGRIDLTGALSALLALQGSVQGSIQKGILRSIAVFIGVAIALGFSAVLGLHWYSLFLAVFAGMFLAPIMKLGDQSIEIAISAMLILGTTSTNVAAENRVIATLIGSAVGVVFPILFPPRVPIKQAAARVADVGRRLEGVLDGAAKQLQTEPLTMAVAEEWLAAIRGVNSSIETARESIEEITDLRRYNMSTWRHADVAPLLTNGLQTLDDVAFATRALATVIRREAPDDGSAAFNDQDIVGAFSYVLEELAACVGRYGDLIQAQALGRVDEAQERFENAVDSSLEAHAMLSELMLMGGVRDDGREQLGSKDILLRGSVLSPIRQILTVLDLDARLAEFDTWRASQLGYELPEGAIGPRIRTPWGHAAQRRMRQRAREFERKKIKTHQDLSEETTQVIPAVKAPRKLADDK